MKNSMRMIGALAFLGASGAQAFDLEAHRGGRALWPENTLPAFANALSLGVDTLELDLAVTKDGAIVVSHDSRLNPDIARDSNGAYVVPPGLPFVQLTLDDVKRYDVGQIRPGSKYATTFSDQRAIPGARIPTLAEVFALVRKSGNTSVRLNIETKINPNAPADTVSPEVFVARLLTLLREEAFVDRVVVQSFDWRTLQLVQKQAPQIPTVYLTQQQGTDPNVRVDGATPWTAGFNPADHGGSVPRTIKAAGGQIWSPLFYDVTAVAVAEAHGLALTVVPWTVNTEEDMGRLIDMGVDGLISDRPDLLRKVAQAKGKTLPAPAAVTP